MASAIRFSTNDVIDANGNGEIVIDPRYLPGTAQVWNAYIDVDGQLAIIQCLIGENVVAAANGTSPALGPVYTLPYEQVTFTITGATPASLCTVTITGYSGEVDDLPAIASPPQNLQGPIVGSAVSQKFTLGPVDPTSIGASFRSQNFKLAGYGGFQLWLQTAGPPANGLVFQVQFYDIAGNFIVSKKYVMLDVEHTIIDTIPMVGDHVSILVQPEDILTHGITINGIITPFQSIPAHNWINDDGIYIQNSATIPGGGATEIFAGYVTTGPAIVTVFATVATLDVKLRFWDETHTANTFWRALNFNIQQAINQPVNIPGYPVSLRIDNSGGGSSTPTAILSLTK